MRSSALVSAPSSGSLAACESDDGPVPPPATSRATPCQRERPLPAPGGAPRAWGGAHREAGRGAAAAAASSVWPVPSASGRVDRTTRPPAPCSRVPAVPGAARGCGATTACGPCASGAGCARGATASTRRPPAVPSVWACGRRAGRPWCLDGPAAMAGAGRPRPGAPGRRRSAPRGRAPGPPGTRPCEAAPPHRRPGGGRETGARPRWGHPAASRRAPPRRCGVVPGRPGGPPGGGDGPSRQRGAAGRDAARQRSGRRRAQRPRHRRPRPRHSPPGPPRARPCLGAPRPGCPPAAPPCGLVAPGTHTRWHAPGAHALGGRAPPLPPRGAGRGPGRGGWTRCVAGPGRTRRGCRRRAKGERTTAPRCAGGPGAVPSSERRGQAGDAVGVERARPGAHRAASEGGWRGVDGACAGARAGPQDGGCLPRERVDTRQVRTCEAPPHQQGWSPQRSRTALPPPDQTRLRYYSLFQPLKTKLTRY